MDPQTTWNSLLAAWATREWLDVVELAEALLGWLASGGFPPRTSESTALGSEWHATVAETATRFALERAKAVLESPDGVPIVVAFTLTCVHCNNEGPPTYAQAKRDGWRGIQYVPAEISENFLGICPDCQNAEDDE